MKIIMRTIDIVQLGNNGTWEFLRTKEMDINKPICGYPCKASNTPYGFAYEGTRARNGKEAQKQ